MLDLNHNDYEDDMNFETFEALTIPTPLKDIERQRPPIYPPPGSGNIPPIGNYPPDFNQPDGQNFNPPGFNFPGGAFTPPGMPKSPPPNYTPSKNSSGVQSFSSSGGGIGTKAVSANSISFCLYKYTYIWEMNGRNYWAFLLNVDRRSISGFRWFGRRWFYFGLDLRRIDSFVCYRSTFEDDCDDCKNLRQDDISFLSSKKEYSLTETRDVYTQTLASIDIPEIKEDFITQTIGYVDDNNIKSDMPCVKIRNIGYRITLEVTYPNNYNKDLKDEINQLASEACIDASKLLSSTRSDNEGSNPLENFSSSLSLIPEVLESFSSSFNSKLKQLNLSSDNYSNITYYIRNEKIYNNWKPYFSTP